MHRRHLRTTKEKGERSRELRFEKERKNLIASEWMSDWESEWLDSKWIAWEKEEAPSNRGTGYIRRIEEQKVAKQRRDLTRWRVRKLIQPEMSAFSKWKVHILTDNLENSAESIDNVSIRMSNKLHLDRYRSTAIYAYVLNTSYRKKWGCSMSSSAVIRRIWRKFENERELE